MNRNPVNPVNPVKKEVIMKTYARICCLLLTASLFPAVGLAQPLGGAIRGEIVTTSGLPQAYVPVTAINQETGEVRRTLSASDGQYSLSSLMPGRYRLEAEAPGFRKHLQAGIELQIGRDVRLDVRLEPGGPSDEVSVSAVRNPVEPDRTNTGGVIDNQQIVGLPLDGRNFLQLSLLLPGTAPAAQGSPGSVRGSLRSTSTARAKTQTTSSWTGLTTTIPS